MPTSSGSQINFRWQEIIFFLGLLKYFYSDNSGAGLWRKGTKAWGPVQCGSECSATVVEEGGADSDSDNSVWDYFG